MSGMMREDKEFYIDSDGIQLHAKLEFPVHRENVDKWPILLVVHGLTGNMEEEHMLVAAEAARACGFASLRVELYGHGMSDGRFQDHTMLKWLDNLMAIVKYVRGWDFIGDIYISGHSQGGAAIVLLAGMMPDVFRGILPLSPAMSLRDASLAGEFLGMVFDPMKVPELIQFDENRVISGEYFRVNQMLPFEMAIERYHGPVLVVHGDEDELVPYSYGVELAEAYENGRLATIPGADHDYTGGKAELVKTAIEEFLKETR